MSQTSRRLSGALELRWTEQLLIGLIVLSIFLIYFIAEREEDQTTSEAAVTRGQGALSLDRLTKYAASSNGVLEVHAWRKPTNFAEDLPSESPDQQSLMFLGLRMRPSAREMKLLEQFLPEEARQIVISGHDDPSELVMESFASAMGLQLKLTRNPNFENFAPVRITSTVNDWPFREGEVYEFYSRSRFQSPACEAHPVHCYMVVAPWHKAQAVFMTGLPIFSNGLLGREDNAKLALRILEGRRQVYVDEYHHYFSERTWWDLAREPLFAFPATIFGLALLLYAFFGSLPRLDLDDALTAEAKDGSRSGENALAFGRRVIQGVQFEALAADAQRLLLQNVRRRGFDPNLQEPSTSADLPTWLRWYRSWLTRQKYLQPKSQAGPKNKTFPNPPNSSKLTHRGP